MGLKLKTLLNKQPPYIINKSHNLNIRKLKFAVAKKTGYPAVSANVSDPEGSNKSRKCQIVVVDTPKVKQPTLKTGWVKVSCDCENFCFYCEYALSKWGAANIRYSNGEPATFTNPDNYPLLCIEENQLITTSRGLIKIKDVEEGDLVLTREGFNKVLLKLKTGSNVKVLKCSTTNGSFKATPGHRVMTIRNNKVKWVRLDKLKNGDYLIAKNFPNLGKKSEVSSVFKIFAECLYTDKHVKTNVKIPEYLLEGNSLTISKFLRSIIELCESTYPEIHIKATEEVIAEQLQTLIRYVGIKSEILTKDNYFELKIPKEETIRLNKFIETGIYQLSKSQIPINLYEFVKHKLKSKSLFNVDEILSTIGLKKFDKNNCSREELYEVLTIVTNKTGLKLFKKYNWMLWNLSYDKVTSVEECGNSDVYDLQIENDHSFLVSNYIVHNCKHLYALANRVLHSEL